METRQETGPKVEKSEDRSKRTRQNNKSADRKIESNHSPEPRGETSEMPSLLLGQCGGTGALWKTNTKWASGPTLDESRYIYKTLNKNDKTTQKQTNKHTNPITPSKPHLSYWQDSTSMVVALPQWYMKARIEIKMPPFHHIKSTNPSLSFVNRP